MKAGLIDPIAGVLITEDGRCGYWTAFYQPMKSQCTNLKRMGLDDKCSLGKLQIQALSRYLFPESS